MLVASLILLGAYALAFVVVPRIVPQHAFVTNMGKARAAWFTAMWAGDNHILFVQTYRNWLMGLNVLASASLILGLGAMSLALGHSLEAGVALDALQWFSEGEPTWRTKLAVLGIIQLTAFANFLLAVRGFNHASILVAVPHDAVGSPAQGIAVLRGAHLHHALAIRILCLSLPAALWIFGPAWLLAGTVLVVGFLAKADFYYHPGA